eukprot:TRINITY_DN62700_c0_g1_i1.p1 TRINITY_DN62700_c0_g1~~TRINITY_DN62700_c0_g1_i1.p1  ORF type:complete len:436 (+),score=60.04 TRINITY_DN62700_c0_g1_i1:222-1529(+)
MRRRSIAPSDDEPDYSSLVVLKVGTSSLIVSDSSGQRLQLANMAQLIEVIARLRRDNYRVVLVTSGAVGMGCIKLGLTEKPKSVRTKQAVAAAGQSQLMRLYEDLFATVRVQVAQLLISQTDFLDKTHWENVKSTIFECLKLGVVPVINENDSTNTTELRFGDNDNLAALLAVQLAADGLFLFTDVDYLYTANPRTDPAARPLRVVREPFALQVDTDSAGSGLGTGGMTTKLLAARTASAAGIPCCLINGLHPYRLTQFLSYDYSACTEADDASVSHEGTFFMPMDVTQTVGDTRRWILSLPVSGELTLDDGAARALANLKSLLPAGITDVSGQFLRNEAIRLLHNGVEVARGLSNFDSSEMRKLQGQKSSAFETILGYNVCVEACHRSNIILIASAESLRSFDVVSKLQSAGAQFQPIERKNSDRSVSSAASAS